MQPGEQIKTRQRLKKEKKKRVSYNRSMQPGEQIKTRQRLKKEEEKKRVSYNRSMQPGKQLCVLMHTDLTAFMCAMY